MAKDFQDDALKIERELEDVFGRKGLHGFRQAPSAEALIVQPLRTGREQVLPDIEVARTAGH